MKLYTTIAELLNDYISYNGWKKVDLARHLGVDYKNVQRWLSDSNRLSSEFEHLLVEKLNLPFQVIHNLNADYSIPVSYNIRTRRFSISEVSKSPIDREFLASQKDDIKIYKAEPITSEADIKAILDYDHSIYDTSVPLPSILIEQSSQLLPELNLIVKDTLGYYCGHLITIPIKQAPYQKLRSDLLSEGDLRIEDLSRPNESVTMSFHFYSVYGTCTDTSTLLLKKALRYFNSHKFNPECILSGYAVTADGIEIAQKLGFNTVFENHKEFEEYNTERIPTFFEQKIGVLDLLKLHNK
ncbi:MAG: hypothetical protein RIG77_20590 [Cyclobacteriaceae bacterium]